VDECEPLNIGIHEPNESIDTQRVSLTVEQFQAFLSAAAADA